MSQHECLVVEIELGPHDNADTLSIVKVFGYQCVVRTADWKDGDLAVYVQPDSICPDTEPFQFLKRPSRNWNRIRVMRLRGKISMGLLIPAPEGAKIGDDLMEALGVTHYEPPLPLQTGGDNEKGPSGWYPKYDVENYRRFNEVLQEGEDVVVTEKIHGANGKFQWKDERLWVGSRTNWKKEDVKNLWWQAATQNPWIKEWCKAHPELVLYGEVYGQVQNLKYGSAKSQVMFAAFDIWDKDKWLDYADAQLMYKGHSKFEAVPELYVGPFKPELLDLAEKDSSVKGADHMREGVVIKPLVERSSEEVSRVQLKVVSSRYLSKGD